MPTPPLPAIMIEPSVRAALLEDLGRAGDLTTDSIVPADARTTCALVARQPGVVCGLDFSDWAFRLIDPRIEMKVALPDGSRLKPGDLIATVTGPARGILTGERVALNFLSHLSGVASATRGIADAIATPRGRMRGRRAPAGGRWNQPGHFTRSAPKAHCEPRRSGWPGAAARDTGYAG